jgi:hypothetical protein
MNIPLTDALLILKYLRSLENKSKTIDQLQTTANGLRKGELALKNKQAINEAIRLYVNNIQLVNEEIRTKDK